jgi:hypothetical protein
LSIVENELSQAATTDYLSDHSSLLSKLKLSKALKAILRSNDPHLTNNTNSANNSNGSNSGETATVTN